MRKRLLISEQKMKGINVEAVEKNDGARTLADIASELGLSESTVSRAMSGKGRISEGTRQRVNECILRRGYRTNMMARGLAQKRTYNICALLPSDAFVSQVPFFQNCLMGICEAASSRDYETIVAASAAGDAAQLERMVRGDKADGYVLMRAVIDDPAVELLRGRTAPFVLIGHSDAPGVVTVDADNADACCRLTRDMLAGGAKSAALLLGDESHAVNRSRLEGFERALSELGRDVEIFRFTGLTDAEAILSAAEAAAGAGAECVFCGDDYICSLAMRRLRELAPELPVASFYGSELLTLGGGCYAAVDIDARSLGRQAAEKLFQIIDERS